MFDCLAFAKDLTQLKKVGDCSHPSVFIRYADGAKAYCMLDPATQHVCVSRDVVFDESRGWNWTKEDGGFASAGVALLEQRCRESASRIAISNSSSTVLTVTSSGGAREHGATTATPLAPPPTDQPQIELAMPLEDDEDRLDAFYDDEPVCYLMVTNIIGDESPPRLAPCLFAQLHLTHSCEPNQLCQGARRPGLGRTRRGR